MLPYLAAILAEICQVELQLGSDAFYTQLLETGLFERSLASITIFFTVSLRMQLLGHC